MKKIETIVSQFLQYLSGRDLENLVALYAEHVDWNIPGNKVQAGWLGRRSDKESVKDFFQTLWKNTEPLNANVEKILYDTDYAVIVGDFKTKMLRTGKIVESFFCIQITVENSLITRYRLFEDSYAVSESLTS